MVLPLTLLGMSLFGAAHGWEGEQKDLHIFCSNEFWRGCTLPKKDPKIYESRDKPLQFCWHQYFFTGN